MALWNGLLKQIDSWFKRDAQYGLNVGLIEPLRIVAEKEKRSPEELALDLIYQGLDRNFSVEAKEKVWLKLSPREQQVAVLICVRFTTPMIANQLQISEGTVKTHIEHIFDKFGVHNRNDLRRRLDGLDFSDWL